jgi:hypothetical protein
MPSWNRVIVSGSNASLNSLNVTAQFTASGLNYPTIDGTTGQVVTTDGAGNLTFSNVENTTIVIKNVSGVTIQKGTPCYITGSGTSGNIAGVLPADASNSARMPAGVIAGETLTAGAEGVGLINGYIANVNTSAFAAGDTIYVAAGGGYTNVRPTGSAILIQKLGNVEKSHVSNGSGVINGPAYYNEVPNIQQGFTWVGNSNGVAIPTATSSIQNVVSSSFASTASFVNPLRQTVIVSGSLVVTGSTSLIGSSTSTAGTYTFVASGSGDSGIRIDNTINGYTSINWLSNSMGLGLMAGGGIFAKVSNGAGLHIGQSPNSTYLAPLAVTSHGTTTGTTFLARNSAGTNILKVIDNGRVGINNANPTASLDVAGTMRISGSFNTAASGSVLIVQGSGSAQPIFTVQGSQGELFSITDSLSGSLFSVNDISGLPVLEAFSDNTVLMGSYIAPSLNTTTRTTTTVGSNTIYTIPTASYTGAFFEYTAVSASNARAGSIMAIHNAGTVRFTETTTTDIGTTAGLAFTVIQTGGNIALTGSSATAGWTIKTIVRSI